MKKLFKAGLAVLTMAMLTSSASAFSPSWETIGDILIGGCEGGGLVFTDAIDLYNDPDGPLLTDQDTTSPGLTVYFAEGQWDTNVARSAQQTDGNATSELTINGQSEINYAGPGNTSLNDQSLLTGGELTGNGATGLLTIATTTDLIDRVGVLIASDGATSPSVSNPFRVRSDFSACDDYSLPVSVTNIDGWDLQSEFNADWTFGTFGISGGAATSGQTGDALIINNGVADQNFSFWQLGGSATLIPASAASAGAILRARFTISSDAAPSAWPSTRLRVFENANHNPANLLINANGYAPAANTSRTYQLFYEAPANLTADLNVAFMTVDASNTQGGVHRLEQLVIDSIVGLDALFSEVLVVDSGEAVTFTSVVEGGISTDISATASAGAFTLTSVSPAATTFESGLLFNAVTAMPANTLYRLTSTVTSTTPVANQPTFGFRLFSSTNSMFNVNRFVGTGANSDVLATTTPKDYVTYLTTEGIDGLNLNIAFDVVVSDTVNRGNGNVTWDRAVLDSVDLGVIP